MSLEGRKGRGYRKQDRSRGALLSHMHRCHIIHHRRRMQRHTRAHTHGGVLWGALETAALKGLPCHQTTGYWLWWRICDLDVWVRAPDIWLWENWWRKETFGFTCWALCLVWLPHESKCLSVFIFNISSFWHILHL